VAALQGVVSNLRTAALAVGGANGTKLNVRQNIVSYSKHSRAILVMFMVVSALARSLIKYLTFFEKSIHDTI